MIDPLITPAMLGSACVINLIAGPIGNRADAAFVSGAKRLAAILAGGAPQQNHHILRATQSAYVKAMRQMADACRDIALSGNERAAAKALGALVKEKTFTEFRSEGEHIPLAEVNSAIDRMFSGGIADLDGGGTEEEHRAFNRAVIADLAGWGVALEEVQVRLFIEGLAGRAAWHVVLRTAFGEELIGDPEARAIFTAERLGEIRAQGIRLIDAVEALHERFDRVDDGQAEIKAMLYEVLANQAPSSERAGIELLQSLADGYAEYYHADKLDELRRYLIEKIEQWRQYRSRIEALEAEGNRDVALLADARAATDRGDFEAADALLAEAEEALDVKLDALLIAKSRRRALRGDNARLAGDYGGAVAFYDEAAELAPASASEERISCRWSAANVMQEWGERSSDAWLLPNAIARWRELTGLFDPSKQAEHRAMVLNNLGNGLTLLAELQGGAKPLEEAVSAFGAATQIFGALHDATARLRTVVDVSPVLDRLRYSWARTQDNLGRALTALGREQAGGAALEAAVAAHRAALTIYNRERYPAEWAGAHNSVGIALSELGRRLNDPNLLREAVGEFRQSLEVRTRDCDPLGWAASQNNLGTLLSFLGSAPGEDAALAEALAAYREALEVRTRELHPLEWALTQENIGNTLRKVAARTGECDTANESVAALAGAVEVFEQLKFERFHDKAEQGLAEARALVERLCT